VIRRNAREEEGERARDTAERKGDEVERERESVCSSTIFKGVA
jgi:hypothetical protein